MTYYQCVYQHTRFSFDFSAKLFMSVLGGKKCTTLLMERGLEGEAQCSIQDPTYGTLQNETMIVPNSLWWSCNEWCLAKVLLNKANTTAW